MKKTVSFRVFAAVGCVLGVSALGLVAARVDVDEVPLEVLAATRALRPDPTHTWQLVRGKHWQIAGPAGEDPATTDATEGTRGVCPVGMVEVAGAMKQDPPRKGKYDGNSIEDLQKRTCTKWINREYPERCAEFDRERWLAMSADFRTKPMRYCMDRFEYPNRKGAYPIIYVNWHEAKALCEEEGKRLCTEDEWTFACEGEEATPYPYGYARDASACVIDAKWRPFNEKAMQPRDGVEAGLEMDRLWQGVTSGSQPRCKSVFGVYDMTGNVDEWTRSSVEGERPSILKGGYWGPVRTRCRPSTRSHDESHVFYQQGFRCCADAPAAGVSSSVERPTPPPTSLDPSRPTSPGAQAAPSPSAPGASGALMPGAPAGAAPASSGGRADRVGGSLLP
jgi:hypothetical protein